MQVIIPAAIGALFLAWGLFRMSREDSFFGKTKAGKNIFALIFKGEASGLGQFLVGVIFIIIAIVGFFIK
ncbi:MAG: hypothetical protein RR543_00650 [Erysipelotrichales bacterium]